MSLKSLGETITGIPKTKALEIAIYDSIETLRPRPQETRKTHAATDSAHGEHHSKGTPEDTIPEKERVRKKEVPEESRAGEGEGSSNDV